MNHVAQMNRYPTGAVYVIKRKEPKNDRAYWPSAQSSIDICPFSALEVSRATTGLCVDVSSGVMK